MQLWVSIYRGGVRRRSGGHSLADAADQLDGLEDELVRGHEHLRRVVHAEVVFERVAEPLRVVHELALPLLDG